MECQQNLAKGIIHDQFGSIAARVADSLVSRGPSTLRELIACNTTIKPTSLREAMLVMLQFGIVSVQHRHDTKKGSDTTLYTIELHQVMYRLRYPRYKAVTRRLFPVTNDNDESSKDNQAAALKVIELLWLAGRQTMGQLANTLEELFDSPSSIKFVLNRLIDLRLIRRAEKPRQVEVDVNDTVVVRGGSDTALDFSLTSGYMGRIISGSAKRKAVDDLEEGAENKRSKTTHDGISGSLTVSSFGLVEEGEDVVLWRLNEKHFHMHMRNTAILDLITKQTGDASAQACVKSLLEMSVLNEQSVNEHTGVVTTQAVGAYQVYKYMVTRNMLPEMGEAKLNAKNTVQIFEALVVLTDGAIETADAATTGAGQFVINITAALQVLQNATVESLIRDRFGTHCERVFRLMREYGKLDQKKIAELAMIDFKDARAQTHKLLTAGVLHIQEVPKTGVRATSSTVFLLSYDRTRAVAAIKTLLRKAVMNLIVKRTTLRQKYAKLIDKIVRDLGSAFVSEHGALHTILLDDPETWDDEEEVLNAKEKDVIAKLQTSLNRITASILLIDQSLLVMDGFE